MANATAHELAESSLPHRQLRKQIIIVDRTFAGSLPHRQLRKGTDEYGSEFLVFTAAQAAQKWD